MDRYSSDFNEHSDALRQRCEADDFDNLQHTLSGVETGHQPRHGLSKDTRGSVSGADGKTVSERIFETLEWLLLNNPDYRVAHESLMRAVRSAQQAAQSALDRVRGTLAAKRALWDEMMFNAARLPDGTLVFKDEDGSVKTLDGTVIPTELVATIEWRGDEPSHGAATALIGEIETLEQAERELLGIETELGEVDERANTNEKPLTPDEMRTETDRVNAIKDRIQELQTETEFKLGVDEKVEDGNTKGVGFDPAAAGQLPNMGGN